MATGKYLSLEEAIKKKKLDRFAKEHQSSGDRRLFNDILGAMAKKSVSVGRTSSRKRRGEG